MNGERVLKSTCRLCDVCCGVLVHVLDGKPTRIEGDPDSPVNRGNLCVKGRASLEYLYHPDRLKHPLKRVGEKGEGKWERISWEEAVEIVAGQLTKAKETYGAKSVAVMRGAAKGHQDAWLYRFANVFGTPNYACQGYVCHEPGVKASLLTCGFIPACDYEYPPACLVIWGVTPGNVGTHEKAVHACNRGAKIISIDPFHTEFGEKAVLELPLRPGSDLALALAMMHVIINEGLYDKEFVEKWTVGFEKLKAHVQDYPPESVAGITWIQADKIKEAARCYAMSKPACIESGNALDHNINSFQTFRAISILKAITGNLGIPGGESQWEQPPVLGRVAPELELRDALPPDELKERVSAGRKLLPIFTQAIPPDITKAILEGKPYPIRFGYFQGFNALQTWGNARETYKALMKLDFLAVADMFMTPTAALADVVLPAACYLEFDAIAQSPRNGVVQVQQKVAEVGESWSDYRILSALAEKMGMEGYSWDSENQRLDDILKATGLTFEEFRKVGAISGRRLYRHHLVHGFKTPSGKVELYSSQLEDWGFDPIPRYYEPPDNPYSDPESAKDYPFILTNRKQAEYRHSTGRQIATLRGKLPHPVVEMHPEAARSLGINQGDMVYIETKRGRIRQKAALTRNLDPRVVFVDYAWWFPEKGISTLYDWAESNINMLIDDNPPYNREMGSTNLKGIFCKIYKA